MLTNKEYIGTILQEVDPKNQGRYKVHIPELMPHFPNTHGFWVKNNVHKFRITESKNGIYGQYFPLQPGTKVIVKFYTEDFNSGYIDRILSDNDDNNLKKPPTFETDLNGGNRDQRYILVKTHKYNTCIYINEDTSDDPKTIYIVFNRDSTGRRSVIRLSDDGIHIYSRDNVKVRAKKDSNIQIDGNASVIISGNCNIKVNGSCFLTSNGDCHIKASGSVNIDGDNGVNINSGSAQPATTTPVSDLE